MLQRRTFVRGLFNAGVALGLVAAGTKLGIAQKRRKPIAVPANQSLGIPIEAQRESSFWFTNETFEPYVGGIFQAPNSRGQLIELRLESVKKYVASNRLTGRATRSDSFSLLFKASEGLPPFTSIHSIKHPSLGEFDLFLTPKTGQSGEFLYEAVFNHVRQ